MPRSIARRTLLLFTVVCFTAAPLAAHAAKHSSVSVRAAKRTPAQREARLRFVNTLLAARQAAVASKADAAKRTARLQQDRTRLTARIAKLKVTGARAEWEATRFTLAAMGSTMLIGVLAVQPAALVLGVASFLVGGGVVTLIKVTTAVRVALAGSALARVQRQLPI
jgi:hypothetical protein